MKKVRIAIIDDGVDFDQIGIHGDQIDLCGSYLKNEYQFDHKKEKLSHGSFCACIINKYAKHAKIEYFSLRVLNGMGRGRSDLFLSAIDWCINNNIDIISCSLGSTTLEDIKKIRNSINQAIQKGMVIVAAQNNNGRYNRRYKQGYYGTTKKEYACYR